MKVKMQRNSEKDDDDGERDSLAGIVASRPVQLSAATFLSAGWLWLIGAEKDSILAKVQPFAPAVTSLAGSFLVGLIVGRIARNKLAQVMIVGGLTVVGVSLLTKFGVIGPAADHWVQSSVGWVSEHIDRAQSYIAALLPSATAAASGMYMGFRRKRKPRRA